MLDKPRDRKHPELVVDTLEAFQGVCRLRLADGWRLHSWNVFEELRGGGRVGHYRQQMVASLWLEEVGDVKREG